MGGNITAMIGEGQLSEMRNEEHTSAEKRVAAEPPEASMGHAGPSQHWLN
jgi:hypothetical protein